ncbi:MAG: hypothetical protein AB2603_19280 [Candidatus Thiodiazotropha endolucinida]
MSEHNPFIWQELATTDQELSGAFFSKLLGWTMKEVDAGEFGNTLYFKRRGRT